MPMSDPGFNERSQRYAWVFSVRGRKFVADVYHGRHDPSGCLRKVNKQLETSGGETVSLKPISSDAELQSVVDEVTREQVGAIPVDELTGGEPNRVLAEPDLVDN